jgi:cyclopropane-fatty-acyl-phospholipid synthase
MHMPLRYLFERLVKSGDLVVIDGLGRSWRFGDGVGAEVVIRFKDRSSERALFRNPTLALGELYMAGRLEVLSGTIFDFLEIVMKGTDWQPKAWVLRMHDAIGYAVRRIEQYNPVKRSSQNVKHHYDIDQGIYDLFLDEAQQYSCAYFNDDDDLEAAQRAKMRHLAAKLDLEPGHTVLDIGSGWGGLATYFGSIMPVDVLGITLSDTQLASSRERAQVMGLDRRVQFEKCDYRSLDTEFDRIVSVGMFEHVGVNHYRTYFAKVRNLLADNGVALIHTIGRTDGPGYTNPFIAKYIFPGGYFPALSEVLPAIEKSGLIVSDVEVLRLHYAETLKAWRERFAANREQAEAKLGEEFCRMWEFYLAGSEAGFRFQRLVVYQIQIIKGIDDLPITRNYMTAVESRLSAEERATLGARST